MPARDAGLIRHLGSSNVRPEHLAEAQAIAPVVCVQNQYGIGARPEQDEFLRTCGEQGVAFVPFYAIAGAGREMGARDADREEVLAVARTRGECGAGPARVDAAPRGTCAGHPRYRQPGSPGRKRGRRPTAPLRGRAGRPGLPPPGRSVSERIRDVGRRGTRTAAWSPVAGVTTAAGRRAARRSRHARCRGCPSGHPAWLLSFRVPQPCQRSTSIQALNRRRPRCP